MKFNFENIPTSLVGLPLIHEQYFINQIFRYKSENFVLKKRKKKFKCLLNFRMVE